MYRKLRGRIVEKFGSQSAFAEQLNVSMQTVSRKMNGQVGFSQEDIINWCNALDINLKDAGLYFIYPKGSKG